MKIREICSIISRGYFFKIEEVAQRDLTQKFQMNRF